MGQKPKTYVELNGKKYDAITGEPVSDDTASENPQNQNLQPKASAKAEPAPESKPAQNGGSLGGVMPPAQANTPKGPRQTPHSKDVHSGPRKGHSLHREAAKQKSKMPAPPPPAETHNEKHDEQPQPVRRQLAQGVDQGRLQRSSKHQKSSSIAKFSTGQPAKQEPQQTEPMEVPKGEPNTSPAVSSKEELIAKQLASTAASQPPPKEKQPLKNKMTSKLKDGRTSSVVAASLAALLLIGYVTYLNIPRMALRVASGRAGFSAELPGYAPSGFSFNGPVSYSPGQLALEYSSNTDDRYYQIKQEETNWDSQTLLDNYVASETELYSTYQERGLTIYVFDGSTATWINGGIWYTIDGDSQLTSEQLLKIAASL